MRLLSLLLLTFCFSIGTAFAQTEQTSETLSKRIDTYFSNGVENGFSGQVYVMRSGETLINQGYGYANKEAGIPNSAQTVFDIGSNTKQFTAAAILILVEQGKVSLKDPLSLYFDDLPEDKQSITVHQLLTHTSGLVETVGSDFDGVTKSEFFEKVYKSELLDSPGAAYSYSNIGYSLLAQIIEKAAGISYESFLQESFFRPLGMDQTGYLLPNWKQQDLAVGYYNGVMDIGTMIGRYQESNEVSWNLLGNGGINATQNDMMLWLGALQKSKVLSADSYDLLTSTYASMGSSDYYYGYGWVVKQTEELGKRISHSGSNGVFWHSIIWYPEQDIQILYVTNASNLKVERLAGFIEKMVFDSSYSPDPIAMNVYTYIQKFIENKPISDSPELLQSLQSDYADEFDHPRVLNRMGNLLLNSGNNSDWAVELFKLNVSIYPEDGNLWDSLAYGYLAINKKEDAIEAFRKAISLGYSDAQEKLDELLNN